MLGQLVGKNLIERHGTNNIVKFICFAFRYASQNADGILSMGDEDNGSWWKVNRREERQAIQKMNFLNVT